MGRWLCDILARSAAGWMVCTATVLTLACGALADTDSSDANDVDEAVLRRLSEAGIEPTEKGIRSWLVDLEPSADHEKRAREALKLLGSNDWRKREQATATLLSLPAVPNEQLEQATQGDDPEVAARAKEVLRRRGEGISPILRASFRVIGARGYHNCLEPMLNVLPLCRRAHVRRSAGEALKAIVKSGDFEAIRRAFDASGPEIRMVLIEPLAVSLGPDRSEKLTQWMNRGKPEIRIRAAVAMLNLQNRAGLKGLVDLLDANDPKVRSQSVSALRAVTGQYFGLNPTESAKGRQAGIKKWSQWVDRKGSSAKLRMPARLVQGCRGDMGGNYLVACGYKNKVEEVDPHGKVVWSHEVKGAWSAEKLPDGDVLVAAYSENKVIVVNAKGLRVWEYDVNCLNAELLPNGNYLVANYRDKRVIEVTREKTIAWSYTTPGTCADAERLPSGNTLVAAGNSVEEVTREGKVVWEHDFGTQVYGVQHLANGNVLVALLSRNRIEEMNRDKKVVWSHNANSAVDAFRLPSGNTLITENSVAYEITPEGKKLWSRDGLSYGTLRK
ncbi:MAG: PQQ-binding-like beta-propeller repeat protein [Phycisphaerae bacterium]